jgi:hypothetical protein
MMKIVISSILISLCIISGAHATAYSTASGASIVTNPIAKKVVKKPIVKKPIRSKIIKAPSTQTSSSMATGSTSAP